MSFSKGKGNNRSSNRVCADSSMAAPPPSWSSVVGGGITSRPSAAAGAEPSTLSFESWSSRNSARCRSAASCAADSSSICREGGSSRSTSLGVGRTELESVCPSPSTEDRAVFSDSNINLRYISWCAAGWTSAASDNQKLLRPNAYVHKNSTISYALREWKRDLFDFCGRGGAVSRKRSGLCIGL